MNSRLGISLVCMVLATIAGCGGEPADSGSTEIPGVEQPTADVSPDGYQVTAVANGGSIGGAITISGPIPDLPAPEVAADIAQECDMSDQRPARLAVNSTGGLRDAVVIVEGVQQGKAMPAALQNAELDQINCEYTPYVTVVAANTEIAVRNSDPVLHNIQFFQGDGTLFNIAQPVQGQVNGQLLENPGVIDVECAVHAWMRAGVVVVDNPYYAVTDENGQFSIPDLPPGTYQVKIWHPYLGEETREVTVSGGTETALNMDLENLLAARMPPPVTAAPADPDAVGEEALAAASDESAAAADEVIVTMLVETAGTTFRFDPNELTIPVGTTVRWVNRSEPRHTSTADPEWEIPQAPIILPEGAEPWRTAFLREGESATHTFTVPGTYQYFCETHGPYGMTGRIVVEP